MMKVRVSPKFQSMFSPIAKFMTASLVLLMAGCGATHLDHVPPPSGPPTVTIAANPATIVAGKAATLTVVATNATGVTISGTDGSSYKMPAIGGTQSVTPAASTTYTATATGTGGTTSAKILVTVTPSPMAPTVKITANPTSINAGEKSTLTVAATNATAVTLSGSDGSSYSLQPAGGTQDVSPTATTTYTATATGPGGKITATSVVTVNAVVPTVTIKANPTTIAAGSSSTLTVAATNASTVTISGSDGNSYTLSPTGGTQSVTPAATTTYTVTAANGGETATATATVTVTAPVAPPTVTIAATPPTITAGSNSTLTVVAKNATTVTIAGNDGSSYTMAAAGGTQVVNPAATTIYTVTATSGTLTATATATVTVVPAPPPPLPTVTISANPLSLAAGASTTVTVTATNATTVTLAGTDGSSFILQSAGGTETVTPPSTSTYTATATGAGGTVTSSVTVTVTQSAEPTVTIAANPTSIASGSSSLLTVTATNATTVTVTGSDNSSYTLALTGGTQSVSPTSTTTYTATADGGPGTKPATATATVTITQTGDVNAVNHVIFMMQENHSFDNYFGMLNPYRQNNGYNIGDDGVAYSVDGIDDKLNGQPYDSATKTGRVISNNDKQHVAHTLYPFKSTCVDDMSSAWTESYGDVSLGNFTTTRPIAMNGYVSNADGFATSCAASGHCSGSFTDLAGDRAMGVYDQGFLNYYYFMASQFALSDRWFSPVSSKSIPNRIATFTGGTTQGLTNDPSSDDKLSQLSINNNIFAELDKNKVSWKIYYTVNNGLCIDPTDCNKSGSALFPATSFSYLTYSYQYINGGDTSTGKRVCTGKTVPSSAVGDASNSFCIDPTHVAPLSQYFTDLTNGTLPSFAFIEAGYGNNDEHPGSGQSVLAGQAQVAKIINALMKSGSWKDSVFFLSYDEGGGPYDHVPPVPGHTNDFTTKTIAANYPVDISTISVNADNFKPCVPPLDASGKPTPTFNCDLKAGQPGSNSGDTAAVNGFAAQEGFRVPNMVISPFTRKHYVSHVPMDHTAIIKFVEDRFINSSAHLTPHDAAEPNLLDFFDFTNVPWATPPPTPAPAPIGSSCQPSAFH